MKQHAGPRIIWSFAITIVIAVLTLVLVYFAQFRWIPSWIITATIAAGGFFFYDKWQAGRGLSNPARRVPEAALLWSCLLGGTAGGVIVMLWRRHKTQDRRFLLALAGVMIIQAAALGFLVARRFYAE